MASESAPRISQHVAEIFESEVQSPTVSAKLLQPKPLAHTEHPSLPFRKSFVREQTTRTASFRSTKESKLLSLRSTGWCFRQEGGPKCCWRHLLARFQSRTNQAQAQDCHGKVPNLSRKQTKAWTPADKRFLCQVRQVSGKSAWWPQRLRQHQSWRTRLPAERRSSPRTLCR